MVGYHGQTLAMSISVALYALALSHTSIGAVTVLPITPRRRQTTDMTAPSIVDIALTYTARLYRYRAWSPVKDR
ncbi:hypothetical protein [Chitinivorax sp. B]|uniref:hypothetical protein n=1 Tax=Chitinivorax sp. B TaxID=2502235 RepID=UPI0010FA399F|nr:hypothetical protein [Chitinivorax sp. B]